MHIPGFRKRCANRGTPSSETDPILNVLNQGSREHLAHYIHPPVIKRGKLANPKKSGLLRWENQIIYKWWGFPANHGAPVSPITARMSQPDQGIHRRKKYRWW